MQAILESTLFSADMSPLVSRLVILFIKGSLVLSATWVIAYMLKGSAAAVRFTVWCAGLLSLMMLPVLSSVLPAWQLEFLPSTSATRTTRAVPAPSVMPAPAPFERLQESSPIIIPDDGSHAPTIADNVAAMPAPDAPGFFSKLDYHWSTWVFIVWLLGVFVASIRLMLAHAGAMLLVKRAELVHDEDWHLLAERITEQLNIEGFVRLRKSTWITVPMSVGVWRSAVVLPANADEWDENQRKTVLLHELAHVKRKDCLLQLLTQMTCAIYWFNPLVWVALWQLRIERERACDDLVLTSGVGAASYAETLLQTAQQIKKAEWSTLATVSMARQSQLEGRLLSILDPLRRRNLNKASIILTVLMMACIALPVALMQPATAQEAPRVADQPAPPATGFVRVPRVVVPNIVIPDITIPEMVVAPFEIPEFEIPEFEIPEFEIPEFEIPEFEIAEFEIPEFEIPEFEMEWDFEPVYMENTPVDSLTIDQIIQLRKHGVDADFIRAIKGLGFNDITYGDLLRLGKYGADADFIADMRSAGYTGLNLSDYANMSKYGVDPSFVVAMKDAGYNDLSASELVSMSKYGVDEEMVALLKAYGYEQVGIDELISASKYGVSHELIKTLDEAGIKNLTISELVSMSKYGVDGRLIELLAAHGYSDLSTDNLVSASKYGVSEELIESLADAGYNNFSIGDLVSASKYGVDGELIASLRTYGYTDMAADELISASKYGLDERLLESLADHGYKGLPLQKVISMSKYGVDGRYLDEMSETGLTMTVDELIDMRKYGVDAAYVKRIKEAGLEDEITVDQLINMRKHGVDAEFIRSLRDNN